jgi:hypothetical protein
MCNTVGASDEEREKCKEAPGNRQLQKRGQFVTPVGVLRYVSVDNGCMVTHEDTNLLAWILAGLVMLIMGTAVGMYSGPAPAEAPTQSGVDPDNAPSPQLSPLDHPESATARRIRRTV